MPQSFLENLNKPIFNYNYSAIFNQNFTENFRIKRPFEKKMALKKALSAVLEENGSANTENQKGFDSKLQTPVKKNSVMALSVSGEKEKIETNPASAQLKKVSVDGMSAFGFEMDLDANEKVRD